METNNKNVDSNELNMSGGDTPIGIFRKSLSDFKKITSKDPSFKRELEAVVNNYKQLTDDKKKTADNDINTNLKEPQKKTHKDLLQKAIKNLTPVIPPGARASKPRAPTTPPPRAPTTPPPSRAPPSPPPRAPTTPGNKAKYAFDTTGTKIIQTNPDGTTNENYSNLQPAIDDGSGSGTKTSTNTEPETTDPTTGKTTQTTNIYKIDKDGNLTTDTKTTNKTPNKIERKTKDAFKTETGVDYSVPENIDPDNNFLLELFDKNINNLVIDLKKHFGDNNKEVNEVVSQISGLISGIKNTINTTITNLTPNLNDYTGKNSITLKDAAKGIYESNLDNTEKQALFTADNTRETEIKKIQTLDDTANNYNADLETVDTNLNDKVGIAKVETRLRNCQALELIHLGLYENFMKTGAFTLTLFEKYKYVTNVMLYLLKNLVNKPGVIEGEQINTDRSVITENGCVEQPKIKLPKPIIKNIAELVAEQGKIQGTIDSIDTELQKTSMDNLMDYRVGDFETNLSKINSPDAASEPNTGSPPFSTGTTISTPPKLKTT